MVLFTTIGFLPCLVNQGLFSIFPNGFKKTRFVTINNIFKLPLIELGKYFQQLLSCLYSYPCLAISQNNVHRAEIFCTLQVRFKIECTLDYDRSTALTVSKIMYLPSLSIFPNFLDIYIACYSHRLAICWCIAERLCQVLHPTICLIRYLIRHINFPQFREYLHY